VIVDLPLEPDGGAEDRRDEHADREVRLECEVDWKHGEKASGSDRSEAQV
jgi:hypothetical protein